MAIKRAVDRPQGWGPAVLTGSTPVGRGELGGSEPLVGRASRLKLRPLTRREALGDAETILDRLLEPDFTAFRALPNVRSDYLNHARSSGFPQIRAASVNDAAAWIESTYVHGVIPRGLVVEGRRVSTITLVTILRYLAASASTELVISRLADALEMTRRTATHHVQLLQDLGLITLVSGWRPGSAKRHVARPKIHVNDGGFLSWAIPTEPTDAETGGFLESLVFRELATQCDISAGTALFHWRFEGHEVDLVLVHRDQHIPIEVKAARSIHRDALRGIDAFATRYPERFHRGIVFYTGDTVLPLAKNRIALPIATLWTPQPPLSGLR